eukprot:CAMPEP_0201104986 /NCGR_PEP_ID=MMETSP0812-20130820/42555_1 /ASSEMBLY_ACC=CAM_ASM_000668 /TAXON_ID=98059 /ORGANISM="Dinobryon sp., Strain UTEXLB2267" /LENGTH=97 /DNA_ID=CAMNT_0047364469 /DNA_START=446 /DNA_END=736 /DNA_ORIENTATION=-
MLEDFSRSYEDAFVSHEWELHNPTEFLTHVIAPIQPDVLIINFGHLAEMVTHKTVSDLSPSFFEAARNSSKHVIWKTTTARCDGGGAMDSYDFLQTL